MATMIADAVRMGTHRLVTATSADKFAMKHINCPNCRAKIEILDEADATVVVTCSHCGSQLTPHTGETTKTLALKVKGYIDEYELETELGHGAFGTVWRARDTLLDNFVAVKIPRYQNFTESEKNLFLREARVMAQLDHPNIVRVRRVIDREELTAIVMDFIRGTTLRDFVANHPFQSPKEAVALWEKVCRAVHHAHEHGVVHRDLKPSNILMTSLREPLVTDFGLAKADSAEFTVGGDNAVLGNVAHMAPEQAAGRSSDADQRSDVYSLGSILYELLTKRTPFEGSKRSISDLKQNFDPLPPSRFNNKVPRDLDTITTHAMEREPDRRYQTAAELADDLRRYLDGKPIVARPVPLFERAWRWAKRNRSLAAAFCVIGVLGVLLCAVLAGNAWGTSEDSRGIPIRLVITKRDADSKGVLANRRREFDQAVTLPRAANARVKFWLRNPATGEPQTLDSPPEVRADAHGLVKIRLPPGDYLVVAEIPNFGFHEVFRTVPHRDATGSENNINLRHRTWQRTSGDEVDLMDIDVPPASLATAGMASYDDQASHPIGLLGNTEFPLHHRAVAGFFLDKDEFNSEGWQKLHPSMPAVADPELPATGFNYDEAIAIAEAIGKRLPTEYEYEVAATNEGTTPYPWGNLEDVPEDAEWSLGRIGSAAYDVNKKGVRGLYSNVAEITETWAIFYPPQKLPGFEESPLAREYIMCRGAPDLVLSPLPPRAAWLPGPALRIATSKLIGQQKTLGVRFARSRTPRFTLEDKP